MFCRICNSLKELEEWNKAWSDDASAGPDAFQKLSYFGYMNDNDIYQCPDCAQQYLYISWNELFPDGWTEFSKLRKLNPEEANKYFE
jgi:RNA polymerase subunit RPABC4/transcription elongation factor Spt4